ncbi:MAG: sugar phosphate isomerase/epimerase [Verrucomicrobia bacterium]|nr:sugar phosphate isomerase/epimerase [Verrucomicrobiota bacterium]MDA1086070.1 sugar phosphate isomerase/epimerase [Verrucomicrobiota bacterium]
MSKSRASKIAAITYTLRDLAKKPSDVPKVLKKVRKIGYLNIQASGGLYIELPPAELRKMADDAGLKIIGAHIGLADMQNDLSAVVDQLETYGTRYVSIPIVNPDKKTAAEWRRLSRQFEIEAKRLSKHGIILQYHNHAHEFEKFGIRGGKGGATAHEIIMQNSSLQAELDVAWVARGGYDPADYLAGLKGRADQIHAKDWGIVNGQPEWRAVGEGGLNWKAIVKAAKTARVKMYIVEQDNCPVTNDPLKSIAISFENLMQMPL